MAADLLVDTSVWVDVFRGSLGRWEASLTEHLRHRRVAVVGQVLAELTQGIRDKGEQAALVDGMAGLAWIETGRQTWLLAGQLAAAARFQGKAVGLGDCVIAAAAKLNDCTVVTRDRDFLRIKGVAVELV